MVRPVFLIVREKPCCNSSFYPQVEKWASSLGSYAEGWLSDWGVRNGIKFALAGVLALFFALLIRLDEPTWAVSTAFVLSTPKYVGAIGEKMILRICGAVAGAVLGFLITGSLEQNPVLFLGAMGGLVAVGTAMYGGTLAPYGFRQCGYTALLVAAQGMGDPQFSWHVGMARCQEVCLGIIVTMVVATCVWPRYARSEFTDGVRGTLRTLASVLRKRSESFLSGRESAPVDVLGAVGGQLAKLRKMIRFGCMESTAFRKKRSNIDAVVAELGVLSAALSNFGRTLPAESRLREYIEAEARELHEALATAMSALADSRATPEARESALKHAEDCHDRYESQLRLVRIDRVGRSLGIDESLEHAGYCLAIREILESLRNLFSLLPEIQAVRADSVPRIHFEKPTLPDGVWIRAGIRAGFAVALSLFLVNWLQPPGGELVVVGTYLFTGFSLEASDRRGDLGVFSRLAAVLPVCVLLFLFLLVAAPLMSSYAVMNTVLALLLFLTGYLVEKGVFTSFHTLFSLLVAVILVGLNAQHAVGFQDIIGPVIGLALASILSTLLQRLIWPALPQRALKEHLGGLLSLLREAADHPARPVPAPDRARIALSAADALAIVDVLDRRTISSPLAGRLREYIRTVARLGGHLMFIAGAVKVPPEAWKEFSDQQGTLFSGIAHRLSLQQQRVEEEADGSAAAAAEIVVRPWSAPCRERIRELSPDSITSLAGLGQLYRNEQSAACTVASDALSCALPFEDIFADRIL